MRSQRLALAAVLLGAFVLRFAGLGRELPHRIEPDAFLAYELQSLERDPALVQGVAFEERYPSLLPRALALLPYPEVPAKAMGAGDEKAHLAAAARPFLLVRTVVALASVLGVALTWLLARRFLSPRASLFAAILAATSLLSLFFSGQARPHGVEATLALAAVLLAISVRRQASAGRIVLATAASALATATLQNGLFALLPLGAGILLGARGKRALLAAGFACAAAACFALAFYPGMPYVDAQGVHLGPGAGGAHWIRPSFANLGGIPALARILWEFEPVLAVLSLGGAAVGLANLRHWFAGPDRDACLDLLVVLAYALPYLGALALDPSVQERFLLPLLPHFACLAAYAVARITARVPIVAALVLALPAWAAMRYVRVAESEDTFERAADWIRGHVDPKERIAVTPGTVLPLLVDADDLRADLEDPTELSLPWIAYQRLLPADLPGDPRWKIRLLPIARRFDPHGFDQTRAERWIREMEAGYVVLEDSQRMHRQFHGRELEAAAGSMGDLVYDARGSIPESDDVGPTDYQMPRRLANRLLDAEAFGPGIRIYRIRR
jgi:hypothetical protein